MKSILEGKTALITGSSRGVGRQVAGALAQLGCKIIIHSRTKENLQTTKEKLIEIGAEVYEVSGELSKQEDVQNIIKTVNEQWGGVDILYNNAAWMSEYQVNYWKHSWEAWETSFRINVFAMYMLCSGFIPGMIAKGYGRIINLTSGIKDLPELAPYGATKAAVDKLTDDISVKLPIGIRINTLDPGWLKTDLGGENAEHPVEAVLPGAIIPAMIGDDGPNGKFFSAIDYDKDLAEKLNLRELKSI
ncbi:MAG: SDR family oxidoreductase [Bacteroidales bacterium]|nr:SDR family oxidoreductase [Bacteroidales bacterium]MBN2817564.1 SDR family oxidoreductase [Bacteroidales bacterium]